jgi:DNA-binding NarL/FixJ family response regulator
MKLSGLSSLEVRMMELLTDGFSLEAIMKRLRIPEGIMEYAWPNIQRKLDAQGSCRAIRAWQNLKPGGPIDLGALSAPELMILELMEQGYRTNEAIAKHLGIAQEPIGRCINKIFRTLKVHSPQTAVAVWKCLTTDLSEGGPKKGSDEMTDPDATRLRGLDPQEIEILELLIEALSNRQIGERVGMTEGNVMRSLASIYKKLQAMNRFEAIRIWQEIKAKST